MQRSIEPDEQLPRETEVAQEDEVMQRNVEPGEQLPRGSGISDERESARSEGESSRRLREEGWTGREEEGYIREDAGGGSVLGK